MREKVGRAGRKGNQATEKMLKTCEETRIIKMGKKNKKVSQLEVF